MKRLLVFLLTAMLLAGCHAHAEETARKADFPDNTFVEMDPNYITGVTQRGKTIMFRYEAQTADGQAYAKTSLVYVPYGHSTKSVELIMYCALPAFFDR